MLSRSEVKEVFEANLKSQSWWAKSMGSQFAIGIVNFIYQVIYRCLSIVNRELSEAHLSLALRPSSVLAAAESKGYVRAKITPSIGDVSIFNGTGKSLFIPAFEPMFSDLGVGYITTISVSMAAGETVVVGITQLTKKRVSQRVVSGIPYFELKLSKEDSENTHKLDVLVDDTGGTELWERSHLFRGGSPSSKMYVEFYTPTEQLGVRFGNGVIGRKIVSGSTVHLDAWLTDGETTLITGEALSFVKEKYSLVTATTSTPIVGGLPQESIEEVRQGALYSSSFNGEVVWGGDYRAYISALLPTIEWISVWGEQEQENDTGKSINNVNKIFICAYSKTFNQVQLHEQIAKLFGDQDLFNLSLAFVDVNLVPLTITLTGKIEPQRDIDDVKARLKVALSGQYGADAPVHTDDNGDLKEIKTKDVWGFIDEQDLLVDYELSIPALTVDRKLPDYRYLDVATSTITIGR